MDAVVGVEALVPSRFSKVPFQAIVKFCGDRKVVSVEI